jgi:archaellin
VDPGEQVDMTVTLTNLSPLLPKSREFTIQVKPNKGAVVIVNRTTPPELKAIMELN